jgi:hypothetical protein
VISSDHDIHSIYFTITNIPQYAPDWPINGLKSQRYSHLENERQCLRFIFKGCDKPEQTGKAVDVSLSGEIQRQTKF